MTVQFPALPTDKIQRWLPVLAAAGFALLIGLELARLIWLVVPTPEGGQWQPRPAAATTPSASAPGAAQLDLNPLLSARLFGEAEVEQPEPVTSSVVDAPDTNLRLTLRGVFATELAEDSRALIEPANGELAYFGLGADVPGGAKLHAIFPDRVLLKRSGRLETLRLDRDAPSQSRIEDVRRNLNSRRSGAPTVIDSQTAARLSEIRTELLNDPTKASDFLRVQPASRNGQLRGYRIYPGRKRELFRAAGLRPGDLVTSINGVQLDDPTKGLGLLGDLSQASQINLTVERGGATQSISVTLN